MNEKLIRVPVQEDVHSHRILRDTVHLIVSSEVVNFATSDKSFPLYQSLCTMGAVGLAICSNYEPYDLILVYRFLSKDHWIFFRLMWWTSYLGFQYCMWRVSHLLGSDVSSNLWKDLEDPGGACLSLLYTSDWLF